MHNLNARKHSYNLLQLWQYILYTLWVFVVSILRSEKLWRMKKETEQGLGDPSTDQSKARDILAQAKELHKAKCYELYIDERTRIMVTKKNFNRAYAEAYKARMNGMVTKPQIKNNESNKTF